MIANRSRPCRLRREMSRRALELRFLPVLLAASLFADREPLAGADERPPASADARTESKRALAEFNSLIGGWRGVGMPRRGTTKGAWTETAKWVWDFSEGQVAVRYDVEKGKLLRSARLTWDPASKAYRLDAKLPDKGARQYAGRVDGKKLVLESKPNEDGDVHRITLTRLNEKRTLVLYEKRREEQTFYQRVAEIGYTRQGTSLAVEGAGEPECVVTGGKGTIAVSHKGQTYYVCCTGCKQAFDDDPEGTLADYRERLAERKSDRKDK